MSHVSSRMAYKDHFLAISYLLLLFWFLRLDHETKIACSTSGRKSDKTNPSLWEHIF